MTLAAGPSFINQQIGFSTKTVYPLDVSKLKDTSVVIKEGCEYQLKFTFQIEGEIVSGLRFQQNISRKGIPGIK